MSFSRRHANPDAGGSRGPSDEMLAVDAASEVRSLTLLYDRYADRLYRFFLVCTADAERAETLLRRLLLQLPGDLQRFNREERTFAGWLFARASTLVWREHSLTSRVSRSLNRVTTRRSASVAGPTSSPDNPATSGLGFDRLCQGLVRLRPTDREAIGLSIGAGLATLPASEAMRLPASLVGAHIQRALQSLAAELSRTYTDQLHEDLGTALGQQHLTGGQRSAHLALIQGIFRGELQTETDEPSRGPLLEIVALGAIVLLGLGGIWVWGEVTTGDTRQHDVPAASQADAESATGSQTPASTTTPVPESGEQASAGPAGETCMAADGVGAFHRFVARFNGGDFDTVGEMLPDADYENPLLEVDPASRDRLQSIFVHHDVRLAHSDEITAYLRDRHSDGERWEVIEAFAGEHYRQWDGSAPLEMYQDWKRGYPGLSMVIVTSMSWIAPNGQEEIASGRVVYDCANELIIQWDFLRDDSQTGDPVGVAEFMALFEPVAPGDEREVRARVRTDARDDGGAMLDWEVVWSEATTSEGDPRERVVIQTLDGRDVIQYIADEQRWWLNWRDWIVYGETDDEDQPVPEEISQSVPWLRAIPNVLEGSPEVANAPDRTTLSGDYSDEVDGVLERRLEVDVADGRLVTARVVETAGGREQVRPELTVLGISRSTGFDPGAYEVGMRPPFPENDVNAPRYQVPDDEWPELRVISMGVGNNPVLEQYRLSWNGVEFDLAVWPSRGGVDLARIPRSVDQSSITAVTRYSHGPLIWAHRQFAGYPTDALWDNGRYRFELALDRDSVQPENDWDLNELIRLADALSGVDDMPAVLRDRGRGRMSQYPVPSMFNY